MYVLEKMIIYYQHLLYYPFDQINGKTISSSLNQFIIIILYFYTNVSAYYINQETIHFTKNNAIECIHKIIEHERFQLTFDLRSLDVMKKTSR
jgi:hypothetical protein